VVGETVTFLSPSFVVTPPPLRPSGCTEFGFVKLARLARALSELNFSNRVTIEGHTQIAFTEDVATRFLGFGWNVLHVRDANDENEVLGALDLAAREFSRPTLIIVESHIGYGAPHKQDTAEAHGEPLGEDEVRQTKRFYGWPEDAQFLVPDGVQQHFADSVGARGAARRLEWRELFVRYSAAYPELAAQFDTVQKRELPPGWDLAIPTFPPDPNGIASRDSSSAVENAIAPHVPWCSLLMSRLWITAGIRGG
jgi:transketolase